MRCGVRFTQRALGAMIVCGAALAITAVDLAAQAGPRGRMKHDVVPPFGPPCPIGERPCPPGLGYQPPPGHLKNGKAGDNAFSLALMPTDRFSELVATLAPPAHAGPDLRLVHGVLTAADDPSAAALVGALTSRGNEGAVGEAEALVQSLRRLTVEDGRLTHAAEAFNAFTDASSDGFLQDPAPEFLEVRSFLAALIEDAVGQGR